MSQGIQERNLPVAESLGEGDKVRIVTSVGNSKNVDASLIGGGGMVVTASMSGDHLILDKTYEQLRSALANGIPIILYDAENDAFHNFKTLQESTCDDDTPVYMVSFNFGEFFATSETGTLSNQDPCGIV